MSTNIGLVQTVATELHQALVSLIELTGHRIPENVANAVNSLSKQNLSPDEAFSSLQIIKEYVEKCRGNKYRGASKSNNQSVGSANAQIDGVLKKIEELERQMKPEPARDNGFISLVERAQAYLSKAP
ncbi:MAG: hypothetical protein NZO16_03735 [Deltaproteobacteria bacterium]|nr:hypothetical protein [Deltaproteobacteria bacterium]